MLFVLPRALPNNQIKQPSHERFLLLVVSVAVDVVYQALTFLSFTVSASLTYIFLHHHGGLQLASRRHHAPLMAPPLRSPIDKVPQAAAATLRRHASMQAVGQE